MEQVSRQRQRRRNVYLATDGEIRDKLRSIFLRHVGKKNMIPVRDLFHSIWGSMSNYNDYQIWWMYVKMYKILNYMRKTGNAFIVPVKEHGVKGYCVVTSKSDAEYYQMLLDKYIKRIKWMKKRCNYAINNELYKDYLRNGR